MCGIAGRVDFSRDLSNDETTIRAMTLENRGPDAEGTWTDRHVALGHRRLAVIDIVGGAERMAAIENGRHLSVVTFSGEIFNFRERAELRTRGHKFRTRGDTEVLLNSNGEWGLRVGRTPGDAAVRPVASSRTRRGGRVIPSPLPRPAGCAGSAVHERVAGNPCGDNGTTMIR